MNYEDLLIEAEKQDIIVREFPLQAHDGLIKGNSIAIRSDMTQTQKACIMAEELGHYYTAAGDILNQSITENRKHEMRGRLWAYNRVIGLRGLIAAHNARCTNCYETAKFLNVTESFLQEAIHCYRKKYGTATQVDNYIIVFEPSLCVIELL